MSTNLTPDQMKQLARKHFEDFVNNRNAAVMHQNMTADFYDHDGPGGKPTDAKGDEQMRVGLYKVMPDLHLTIEEMVGDTTRRGNGVDSWPRSRLRREARGRSLARSLKGNAPTQSSATIIAAYLDAVIRKDASAVDRYFDPDVEYMVNSSPSGDSAGVLPPVSVAAELTMCR